ncbi:MAG: segregation/condensation protein A [Candidatus Krumholzibacteriales bacterium]
MDGASGREQEWPVLIHQAGAQMVYLVKLDHFEGPLDLLLHLIRRDKLDIYDIPISHITHEYLAYIDIMKEMDLDIAGEFFVMAATLMRIKAKMLLPRRDDEEEEEEDPRDELVRNLLEYRKFKKAAEHLAEKEEDMLKVYRRPSQGGLPEYREDEESLDLSVFDLMDAFRNILGDLKKEVTYKVLGEQYSVEEKLELIRRRIDENSEILFTELFEGGNSRAELIVTFIAILELMRNGTLIAKPMKGNMDIWIYRTPQKSGDAHG